MNRSFFALLTAVRYLTVYLCFSSFCRSRPTGDLIENILTKWAGDDKRLEKHHGWIQWVFPIPEKSAFNVEATPLSMEEAEEMRKSPIIQQRLIRGYIMFMKFLGIEVDPSNGQCKRAPNALQRYKAWDGGHNTMRYV